MPKFSESQEVKLFVDENNIGKQEVHIDTDDECGPWMNILHDGSEFSLSLENWDKLVQLAEKAKAQIPHDLQSSKRH